MMHATGITKTLEVVTVVCFMLLVIAVPIQAQDTSIGLAEPDQRIGIGGQIGAPTGITLQIYKPQAVSYNILAGFHPANFFLNGHAILSYSFTNTDGVEINFGPGAFALYRERVDQNEFALGLSGRLGISYFVDIFELFGHITPRYEIVPDTGADLGGGVGVRFYF